MLVKIIYPPRIEEFEIPDARFFDGADDPDVRDYFREKGIVIYD